VQNRHKRNKIRSEKELPRLSRCFIVFVCVCARVLPLSFAVKPSPSFLSSIRWFPSHLVLARFVLRVPSQLCSRSEDTLTSMTWLTRLLREGVNVLVATTPSGRRRGGGRSGAAPGRTQRGRVVARNEVLHRWLLRLSLERVLLLLLERVTS